MMTEYTYTDKALAKLEHLCNIRAYDKYDIYHRNSALYDQLGKELSIIKNQGSASLFILAYEALCGVDATPNQYCLRGVEGSSLVAYILGFTEHNPFESVPRLYPEFCYGIHGDRILSLEMNVTSHLYRSLVCYFEDYPLEAPIKHRHTDCRKIKGIRILDNLSFMFLTVDEPDKVYESLRSGAIFDEVQPKSFEEQIKCLGLEHGTGTWEENAKDLLESGEVQLKDIISHREDVFEYLMSHGIDRETSYKIAEDVRKGRVARHGWSDETLSLLNQACIPVWYVKSCEKIEYLFPRAHDMMLLNHYKPA